MREIEDHPAAKAPVDCRVTVASTRPRQQNELEPTIVIDAISGSESFHNRAGPTVVDVRSAMDGIETKKRYVERSEICVPRE